MFTTILQHFHKKDKLLWVVIIGGQKNNFNDRFILESITTYHTCFVMKIL